jgi:pilus assembly protein Flp/PilA
MMIMRFVRYLRPVPQQLLEDQRGATAIEYGLLATLIALAIVAGVSTIAPKISATFTTIAGKL